MQHHFDPDLVDESVTVEDVALAHDGTPADFPDVAEQDTLDDDHPDARGLIGVVPATPAQAIQHAKALRDNHTYVGVGRCLATVRGPIFRLPGLWPDATAALAHGAPIHEVTVYSEIPRGAVVGFHNNGHGHVALGLGGGLCSTTDYHENGYEGVALISRTASWCSADRVVWYETLEGYDVWPDAARPVRPPWTWEERLAQLEKDLQRAKSGSASKRKIDGLTAWIKQIKAKHA